MLTTDFVTKQVFRNLDVDVGKKNSLRQHNIETFRGTRFKMELIMGDTR